MDLTDQVEEMLESLYDDFPGIVHRAWFGLWRKALGMKPFEVLVTCPGSGGHDLMFRGVFLS